jgi:sucrose synthase
MARVARMNTERIQTFLTANRASVYTLLHHYFNRGQSLLLSSDLADGFAEVCGDAENTMLGDSALAEMIHLTQEATVNPPWMWFAVRPDVGRWQYLRLHAETLQIESFPVDQYLAFKESIVPYSGDDGWPLAIDLEPFGRSTPRLKESRSIGSGLEFLNRQLSAQLLSQAESGAQRIITFLSLHSCNGRQLMLDPALTEVEDVRRALRSAESFLDGQPGGTEWAEVAQVLRGFGFETGWGKTVSRISSSLRLFQDVLEAPSAGALEDLLARIPMIFNLAILSPHGYFAQSNVMGLPDTGGQVVYILDQVRALELEMRSRLDEQGVEYEPQIVVVTRLIPEAGATTCNERLEPISGTRNARILRIPFRSDSGEIIQPWISRFEVWPYLERFAIEAEGAIVAELETKPDMVIGNYSDGNLVASIIGNRLDVTTCTIAHALEKTKYLLSDLHWRDNEDDYHFSCQFTADLIAMNSADFIITSTYQEIAGTAESVGQYESYGAFTMPGLYRVVSGVDVFDPRFNIVSPGADPDVYFPFTDSDRRLRGLAPEIDDLLFGSDRPRVLGHLEEPDKPIVFSIARMDRIKNLTGLVDWYGRDDRLREQANLVLVAGFIDPAESSDSEEAAEIQRMHDLIDQHELAGQLRWIEHVERMLSGELYRTVADRRGVFVQPALFEAFGLTVIEAMSCGVPTFATRFGGPLEIIEHGVNGFHIDPNHGEVASAMIADFLDESSSDPEVWESISKGAVDRVESRYTWKLYARRLMTLSRIYGFWKFMTDLERSEARRYLDMFYALQFRPRARMVIAGRQPR